MKIYISVDMEGITGVATAAQCTPGEADYPRFRRLMTQDTNAAVAGAIEGGADVVFVNDSHGPQTNILIEELHPTARLISGSNKLLPQMEGIDKSFQAVFFVGHHQGEGLGDGILNHTHMSTTINEVRVNGTVADEVALNALLAAEMGVPVGLVAGDDCVCTDAERRFPGVEVAPVKIAIDRFSANSMTPTQSQALIHARAKSAVEKALAGQLVAQPVATPVTLEVDFKSTASAHMCTLFPQVTRLGPRSISVSAESFIDAYHQYWGLCYLAMYAREAVIK